MNVRALVPGLLAVLVSAQAHALVVETWTRRSLQFTNVGRAEVSATATGLATLNTSSSSSHLSTLTLPLNPELAVTQGVPVTDPSVSPITFVVPAFQSRPDLQGGGVIGNISGAIASSAGALSPNTIPLTGGVTVCLLVAPLPPCLAQLPLVVGGTRAGSQLGHGVGGLITIGGTGSIRITLIGAPYTVKTVSAANRTANGALEIFTARGFAHGPLSLTSSTAATSGVLQMVTANKLVMLGYSIPELSGQISELRVHVVPEPAWLLLFAAGVGGLVLLGRKRERRR